MEAERLRRLRSVNESRLYHLFHKIPHRGERADSKIRLAGAVGAKDRPMFASVHCPVDPVEDADAGAADRQVLDIEKQTHRE